MAQRRTLLRVVAALLLILAAPPALAHSSGARRTDGLRIEPLSHGQMAAIDTHRAAVLALAERGPSDETGRRLLNYEKLQFLVCLWGVMPGTLDDETSPFNGCAHAYLAATRALLAHLRGRPDATPDVIALAETVDRALLLDGTLAMCVYSGEPYNTADLILPEWSLVPAHPPTLLALGGGLAAMAGGGLLASRLRRRERPEA
ncbi:hypothetical protein PQJ75_14705 [Rhodoplanes sp. TEM]|uniref:Secreted protein n=1 Tax=Rhodoplanes tepidamans TaxID=200616 RepID=A0ABT5J8S5_RHOTP|nr:MULTISPECIES: hypothetical protein [Rhodoplanes]MDC7785872.1 hypothetical protein [Rhodoplanes tepidamans]MDC7984984.1 hypothetical protein [Rhodoplanes sp. TEM]MDQ0355510.1 hypothetical protein [Rhodoplanes tepidamans]